MDKSVFSHLRTLKTWHSSHLLLRILLRPRAAAAPAVQQLIAISYAPRAHSSKPAARQTDGQTDSVPLYEPCSVYYACEQCQ